MLSNNSSAAALARTAKSPGFTVSAGHAPSRSGGAPQPLALGGASICAFAQRNPSSTRKILFRILAIQIFNFPLQLTHFRGQLAHPSQIVAIGFEYELLVVFLQ